MCVCLAGVGRKGRTTRLKLVGQKAFLPTIICCLEGSLEDKLLLTLNSKINAL
jgi:hypothetical protein